MQVRSEALTQHVQGPEFESYCLKNRDCLPCFIPGPSTVLLKTTVFAVAAIADAAVIKVGVPDGFLGPSCTSGTPYYKTQSN